ncbi:MAG: hypothetical protein GEU90_21280 [Gemmatimonas sp.]|nr:hypothetical protein [Gemmatimonas sp.]
MNTPEDQKRRRDLLPPSLPRVARLSRNVLLVAGLAVAVIVMVVSRFVGSEPEEEGTRRADRARVEASASMGLPGFLLRPPQDAPVPPPAYADSAEESKDSNDAEDSGTVVTPASAGRAVAPVAYAGLPQEPAGGSPQEPRDEAYLRALQAPLRPQDSQASGMPTVPSALDDPSALDPYGVSAAYGPMSGGPLHDAFSASPAFAASADREGPPPNRHEAFLEGMAEAEEPTPYIPGDLVDPISEYQLMAGTVLPAMIVTGMNSDMPGEMLAQISRDVYDSQQRHVLIPRGTKVLGRYDSQVSLGQSRALVAWTRLIFPDGRSLPLPGLPTKDLLGASGVKSDVDNHYMRLYGQGVLLSIIGAGAQLSQTQQSSVLAAPAAGQVAAGALGRELSQISMETIRRNMDVRPTLEVKAGTPFYIFLARDLVLNGPYTDQRLAERQP